VHLALSRGNNGLGAVAFEFYTVQEPHEHLQKDPLVFLSLGEVDTLARRYERFVEWVPRNLGKRARVWTFDSRDFYEIDDALSGILMQLPWHVSQECDIKSLIWAAQQVHGAKFKVPDVTNAGLDPDNPMHMAARHATLLQASMRALMTLAR
jgi:hypothetical protein